MVYEPRGPFKGHSDQKVDKDPPAPACLVCAWRKISICESAKGQESKREPPVSQVSVSASLHVCISIYVNPYIHTCIHTCVYIDTYRM